MVGYEDLEEERAAVRALLREERSRRARALPASGPDWRLMLAFHLAGLAGRGLSLPAACRLAAVDAEEGARWIDGFHRAGLLHRDTRAAARAGGRARYRLSPEACEYMTLWTEALALATGVMPAGAAPPPPPPTPPPAPRG